MKAHEVGLIVRRALANARNAGLTYIEQNEHAVQALSEVDPGLTGARALEAVNLVRRAERHEADTGSSPTYTTGGASRTS